LESLKTRVESDTKRYKKYYGVNIFDLTHYDIVLDTTKLGIEEVAQILSKKIGEYKQALKK
jgi:cytidylate kinase